MADFSSKSSVSSIDDNYQVEFFNLSATDIANKQVTLAQVPVDPEKVSVDPIGGPSQAYLTDFIVTGNVLDWSGRGLETALVSGDVIRVIYIL